MEVAAAGWAVVGASVRGVVVELLEGAGKARTAVEGRRTTDIVYSRNEGSARP